MTKKDVISYWIDTATEDLATADGLFQLKKYHHCLFFCHLALEKLLKGLVYKKTKSHPLPLHNLAKLAEQADLGLSPRFKKDLEEITTWNIQARYDTIKRHFYKKATPVFTKAWLKKIKEMFVWLKNQY